MWSKDLFSSISTTMWLTEDRPVPLLIPAPFRMASQNGNPTFPPLRLMVSPRAWLGVAIPVAGQQEPIRHGAR